MAKIDRWLAATSVLPNDPSASSGGHRSVNSWADLLDDVLAAPRVPYFGIVGHWYSGDTTTENVLLSPRVPHTVAELRGGGLGLLARDVIHDFRPGAAGEPRA